MYKIRAYVEHLHEGNRSSAAKKLGVSSMTIGNAIKYSSAVVIDGEFYSCKRLFRKAQEEYSGK